MEQPLPMVFMEQLDTNISRHIPVRPEVPRGSSSHGSRTSDLVLILSLSRWEAHPGSSRLDSNLSHQTLELEACTSLTTRLVPSSRMDQGMVGSLECYQIHLIAKVLVKHLSMDHNILGRMSDHRLKMT